MMRDVAATARPEFEALAHGAMAHRWQDQVIDDLRERIRQIERTTVVRHGVLSFGVTALDNRLPEQGLALGALHEIAGGSLGAVHGAAVALFAAGILARLKGPVLWCLTSRDLFAPALAGVGLHPDRVIYVEAGDENTVLLAAEEGLRHGGLAGVVGELARLPMAVSRRLQLAAESSGVVALILRRWRNETAAAEFGSPTAAASRWRITALPSTPQPTAGVGRARWHVELVRCRNGEAFACEMEACDAEGYLALPANVADRSVSPAIERRTALA